MVQYCNDYKRMIYLHVVHRRQQIQGWGTSLQAILLSFPYGMWMASYNEFYKILARPSLT